MSHTPVPEEVYPHHDSDTPHDYLAEAVNQLIDWAQSIEKRVEGMEKMAHVTRVDLKEQPTKTVQAEIGRSEIMKVVKAYEFDRKNNRPPALISVGVEATITKQPSEVVRPDQIHVKTWHTALGFTHTLTAEFPTREAAETARKMLLGNVE